MSRYPVYIISKGRSESRLTSKMFEADDVSYRIVIEPQEYEQYAAVIDPEKILILPFSNLGQGSIPARNWVWEYSMSEGHERHWILDDNIRRMYRWNGKKRERYSAKIAIAYMEQFIDRYSNLALAGPSYTFLCGGEIPNPLRATTIPFQQNTRIYSFICIDNTLPFRWRGQYNEDTDLSLRVLKAGLCTVLFRAFLCSKQATLTMKGGNTDELYQGDGRLKMAQSLQQQHPDVVKVVWKFSRPQHLVDYRPFKQNKLIRKPGVVIPEEPNEYGMELVRYRSSASNRAEPVELAASEKGYQE